MSFAKFGSFSAIIIFSTTFFLLSYYDSNDMNVRPFVLVPRAPEILLIFSQSFFNLCYSDCIISINLSSISESFLCHFHLLLKLSSEFLILISVLVLLYTIYFFAKNFIFPFASQQFEPAYWNICVIAALKSSSDNPNIYVIPALASVVSPPASRHFPGFPYAE